MLDSGKPAATFVQTMASWLLAHALMTAQIKATHGISIWLVHFSLFVSGTVQCLYKGPVLWDTTYVQWCLKRDYNKLLNGMHVQRIHSVQETENVWASSSLLQSVIVCATCIIVCACVWVYVPVYSWRTISSCSRVYNDASTCRSIYRYMFAHA